MSDKNSKKPTQSSIVSKPSTAQGTDSPNIKRWFRQTTNQPNLPELNHLFDLYWGGPERRITGLTLKVISVNMIALIMLLFGVLYLGQYQNSIIETKLKNFEREAKIISIAISALDLSEPATKEKVSKLIGDSEQEIKIFDENANMILNQKSAYQDINLRRELRSVQILKDTASLVTSFLPDAKNIPTYPREETQDIPDLKEALSGFTSLSAWQDDNEEIILSVGTPLLQDDQTKGAIVIIRQSNDIKEEIGEVWRGILKIFIATLLITLILSIYLAGTIAKPLKKLAKAAESVRTGRATGEDIPDFSDRYDEIGDLSLVLRSMTDALWAKMDSIESFAADVAHELKNPLTSLSSAIETLQKVKKNEDREKLLGIITHDIERMDRLITDISSASRLDAELSRTAFTKVSIETLIRNLLESYKDPIKRKASTKNKSDKVTTPESKTIELSIKPRQNSIVNGSEDRLQQVFQNLVDNALSFSKKKGTVTLTVNRGENLVAIHIDDEGPGIPEKKLTTIFDRFYTERPEESYGQHSGLGLSICKQIIESHRGELFAENRRDKDGNIIGARFSIVLKAHADG